MHTLLITAVTQGEVLDLSLLPLGQGKESWTQAAVLTLHKGKMIVILMQLPNSIFEDGKNMMYWTEGNFTK